MPFIRLLIVLFMLALPCLSAWADDQAEDWEEMQRKADRGEADAQQRMGGHYYATKHDYAQAEKWWRKAADQGQGFALYSLCRVYAEGKIAKDYFETYYWCKIAYPKSFDPQGMKEILESVSAHLSPGQIADADRRVKDWKPVIDPAVMARNKKASADFQAGQDAYNQQDYQSAFRIWLPVAQQDDALAGHENARAAAEVGKLYFEGKGTQQDYAEAIKWSRIAVKRGNGTGSTIINKMRQVTDNEVADDAEIARLYPAALEKDTNQKADWKKRAANGDAEAQLALARFYGPTKWNNFNGERDLMKASMYYDLAAEQDNIEGKKGICSLFSYHRSAGGMNGQEADDAFKNYEVKAVKWCRQLAEKGDAGSQRSLGRMYLGGWGVRYDRNEALKWYLKAAEQQPELPKLRTDADKGDADAQFALGSLYGCMQHLAIEEMLGWWRKAAIQGNWRAQLALGSALYGGGVNRLVGSGEYEFVGVQPDRQEAYFWYSVALKYGQLPDTGSMVRGSVKASAAQGKKYAANYLSSEQIAELDKRADDWKPKVTNDNPPNLSPADIPRWVGEECAALYRM